MTKPVALVVDDAADMRQLIAAVLVRAGFDVVQAESGLDALAIIRSGSRTDVAILDVQMPLIDGWDTLAEIRADPNGAELPVVLCTVKSSPADRARAEALGCSGYLTKPFAITDLVERVTALLARQP